MTNFPAYPAQLAAAAQQTVFIAVFPIPIMGLSFAGPGAFAWPTAVASPPVPAPATATAPAPTVAASAPSAPTPRTPAGAGLPAPLIAMLRTEGPFTANEVYSVPPTEPLLPIEEAVAAPEWYAITRGRFVGVVDQFALSAIAISGVAHSARKAYTTQALALNAFNQALTWGGVQVA